MTATIDPSSLSVALLAGGASGEREISLASGAGASEALKEAGFNVTILDPAEKEDLKALLDGNFDVAFICLHGKYGEDGTIQGLLEILNIPYIGSGVWSSSLAMDKSRTKVFYRHFGINTPRSITLHRGDSYQVEPIAEKLGFPCVVKPANEGSALGVHIVDNLEALGKAIEEVAAIDTEVLMETYIKGTELTVAVLGNKDPIALPVIEIVPKNEFYDFESKYAPGGSEHICPARLSDEDTANAQQIAIAAHKALGCRGVSRTDIILDEAGVCWVLETNTVPGMTATSLFPDSARAAGYSFPEVCTKLIELALED
ncbi:MAG: D-alanine--D-alanine ligase [Coriobacteriia bacterium]|nr:D-alanine--D-alanine ligase [Coriobacteriia bacterium]